MTIGKNQADNTGAEPQTDDQIVQFSRRIFSGLAILLVFVGEVIVFTSPVFEKVEWSLTDPILRTGAIWIAGILLFIWSQDFEPPGFMRTWLSHPGFSGPMPWVIYAFVFSVLTVVSMILFEGKVLREPSGRLNFIPVLALWILGGICYFVGFAKDELSTVQWREWIKKYGREVLGIGLITILAFCLRFYKLGEIPKVVNGDEGRVAIAALSTNIYPYVNPFALWENFGALYLQAINLLLSIFGSSSFSLRLIAAIGGTIAIPSVYLLARQISGPRVGMMAAALIAMAHTQIHFSRTIAVAYIQGTWLIPLELYFLLSGLTKRSSWRAALAGLLLAIHFEVYLDSQIIAAMILIYMVLSMIFLRSWLKPALRQVAIFWGGFVLMLLPELVFIWQHPNEFFQRINKDGIIQSGWLARTMQETGSNALQIFGQRIAHTFLSLIYYPAFDFYGSPAPALSLITALFFLVGLGLLLWKTERPEYLLLNGYFWGGTFAVALFSIPPSADTYRMLIVLPAALIMAAVGLDYMLEIMGAGWGTARVRYIGLSTILLVSILAYNAWTYYGDFAGRCLYGTDDGPTRFASFLGNYAEKIDGDSEIFLLSDKIYYYGSHQSVDFLSHRRIITNVAEPADSLPIKPGMTVIANPNRVQELRDWANLHLGGKLHSEYDCQNLILFAYQLP